MADVAEMLAPAECPRYGIYPTVEELVENLGYYAFGLYVFCGVAVTLLALLFGSLLAHFRRHMPRSRQTASLWVNSIFLALTVFTAFTIIFPKSSDFVWMVYRIYLGMAMSYFVKLTVAWYGGEEAMLEHVGENNPVNLRVRPCCFLCCCPTAKPFSLTTIHFIKLAVYQIPYVQATTLFVMSVLQISGYLEAGNMACTSPYLYLTLIYLASFVYGMWGLFAFLDITHRYKLLVAFNYKQRAMMLKLMLVLVNIQTIVVDILAKNDLVGCYPPNIGPSAMAIIIKALLIITESLVIGSLCHRLYITDTHI